MGDGSESLQRRTEMDYKEQAYKLELRFKYDRMGLLQLGSDLCKDCSDAGKSIIELLARAEEAEERCKELEDRCKRLNEARERANEAAAKWESAYKIAMERAESGRNKGNLIVCPVCNGSGKVHTGFYGLGSCSMADVMNDKFPPVCRTCKGKGIIEVNEFVGVE